MNFKEMKELDVIKLVKDPNTDEVTYNKACEFLLKKYEKMIHYHWHVLSRQMDYSDIVMSMKEEYYEEAYESFLVVIKKVDLNKIYDENFKLMQLMSWYITNVRTKMIKEVKKRANVKSITLMKDLSEDESDASNLDPDVELSYWNTEGYMHSPEFITENNCMEDFCKKQVSMCLNNWPPLKQQIYSLLEQHKSNKYIAKHLKIKLEELPNILDTMKNELKAYLLTN